MNQFKGHITKLQSNDNLSIVTVAINDNCDLKAIVIDTEKTAPYLGETNLVAVYFKETEVSICIDNPSQISIQNKVKATVTTIEKGVLLSRISLNTDIGPIISIIPTEATEQLNLTENNKVWALIKLNDVTLGA